MPNYFLPIEDKALKDFVKGRTGDELAPIGQSDSLWVDLAKRWKTLGKVKGFQTDRSAVGMYKRHLLLRRKAGRTDSPPKGCKNPWSAEEEKALLDFVKERKGDEMAAMWSKVAFKDLEEAWQSKGFDTARNARAMSHHHNIMRNKRAEQTVTTPQPSSTSSTTSATTQDPSLSSSGRKRTLSAAFLAMSPSSSNAKKPKPSSSPSASASASATSSPPPPACVTVKMEAPDSDSELLDVKIEAMLEMKEER